MGEDLLEAEAVEEATEEASSLAGDSAPSARPLPERRHASTDVSAAWKGEVRTAALAAAGGLVAGAATVVAVRAGAGLTPSRGSRKRLLRSREKDSRVVASRSFLIDVHLLDR